MTLSVLRVTVNELHTIVVKSGLQLVMNPTGLTAYQGPLRIISAVCLLARRSAPHFVGQLSPASAISAVPRLHPPGLSSQDNCWPCPC